MEQIEHNQTAIDTKYLEFCKLVTAVQGDMGWKTAGHRQKLCMLRLWLRLMNMDREMIASKLFWHSYTLAQGRCKNWCFLTIKMFNELGMGFLTK